ncbi:UDP-glycosyltransferase 83A1-like [Bidens hawaiensis]|uniref:UDP-glycosyltransferase 83A1-like n=1 Tax=Bidens hawaiensis TaxID=980011 RepID=UPI004049FA60
MELAQCLVTQGVKFTFINTEASHILVTSNCLDKDDLGDMHMVSVPDGLDPWDGRSDLCKLGMSMLQTMRNKLEELIEMINKEDPSRVTCIVVDDSLRWAVEVAKKMGIRRAVFRAASVATMVYILSEEEICNTARVLEMQLSVLNSFSATEGMYCLPMELIGIYIATASLWFVVAMAWDFSRFFNGDN